MVSAPLAIVVTCLFAGAAMFSIARLAKSHSPITQANYGLHLVMSLAMIAMAWPGTTNLLTPVQLLVFAVATLWFVARFVVLIRRGNRRRPALDLYHAVMMATMTLMVMSMRNLGSDMSAMSHGGWPGAALAAMGGFFAVAVVMWVALLIQRLWGNPPSRLRTRLSGEAIYELAMAAGMAIMAFSTTA